MADAQVSGDDIWVAQGTYKPDQGGGQTPGDRTATFQLINGVAIYGGFAGGETSVDERDWQTNETILSGDINTPDVNTDNSYHIIYNQYTEPNAVLDGFTITAGNASGSDANDKGAGMYNAGDLIGLEHSSPTVANCTFANNSADWYGGGMYNERYSSPTVTNCTFSGNSSGLYSGGMYNGKGDPTVTNCTFTGNQADSKGGGMYNFHVADPTVTNCTFSGNSADVYGGGMDNFWSSSPTVANCSFSGNSADSDGGGMCNDGSSPTVTNSMFSGNAAIFYGGGMVNYQNSSPMVTSCLFSGNTADANGGGMYNEFFSSPTVSNCTFSSNSANYGGGMINKNSSSPTLTNCILWDNTASCGPQIYNDGASSATVSYSDVQGGWSGTGNIPDDPLFIGPDGRDGLLGTTDDEEGNEHLRGYSPCINAGDPSGDYTGQVDVDGQPRVAYGRVDIGADEVFPIAGDFEPDDDVDFADFAYFANNWLLGVE